MGNGADPGPAPPRGLRIGGDADRAGDMGGPAVAGLHQPVVVAGGEVEDVLAPGGLHDLGDVAHDQRAARQRAEVDRLEVREQAVVALDRHHRLAGRDRIALVQGVDDELVPSWDPLPVAFVTGAGLEHRDRLIDPAEDRILLLEDLHRHPRMLVLGLQQLLGVDEVRVGVVAGSDPLHREAEDVRVQPRRDPSGHAQSLLVR